MKKWLFAVLVITTLVIITIPLNVCKEDHGLTRDTVQVEEGDTVMVLLDSTYVRKTAKELDRYFSRLYRWRHINGNVLIAKEGQVIYENSFGYKDIRKREPLDSGTVFQLASLTKQFTAVAIMMLYEQGKLEYSDTIQKYFPDFPYKDITIELLLTHRSGLPNYIYLCDHVLTGEDTIITNMDVMDLLTIHNPWRYFRPDRKFDYSNTGYIVLVAIIEKVSGMSYEEFMKTNIFDPLNMDRTFVYNYHKLKDHRNIASGHNFRRRVKDKFLDGVVGDKGIYSTTEDLLKWDQGLYTDKLLSQKTLQEAFKPHSKELRRGKNYGFGWRLVKMKNDEWLVYHRGWWHGFQNMFIHHRKEKITIIVLQNRKTKNVIPHQDILKILEEF